ARHVAAWWHAHLQIVSVDHRRAGLRALLACVCGGGSYQCQSITGALACAPCSAERRPTSTRCVSRSPARWPARRTLGVEVPRTLECQSITGALACAPPDCSSVRPLGKVCQSITGALACAPDPGRRGSAHTGVSVDHRRAGLRAHEYKTQKFMRLWCQSITGALACAPRRRHWLAADVLRVSRSPARWPARPALSRDLRRAGIRVSRSPARWPARWQKVSVDHRRAGLRAQIL